MILNVKKLKMKVETEMNQQSIEQASGCGAVLLIVHSNFSKHNHFNAAVAIEFIEVVTELLHINHLFLR